MARAFNLARLPTLRSILSNLKLEMLECPQFDDIRAQYPDLLQNARDSMRNLMWHQNQKALSDFVIAILDEPRT